ncbi:hypothetical protein CPC08DRAFT_683254 [Agrocybe pediades]|nr:hypothetical protein CPC08DRAFT_683254 [Agrocybe pediades]
MQVHEKFNALHADVTIRSSDGVLFKLHRANLSATTGAFPGTDISTEGVDVQLTEPSVVLEIIFQFIYPQKHPPLKGLTFDVLLQVAEAVEKYEVFPAMWICETRLRERIKEHALKILLHGIKHDYPDLINESSLQLALRPIVLVARELSPNQILPWIQYREAWRGILADVKKVLDGPKSGYSKCSTTYYYNFPEPIEAPETLFCLQCVVNLKAWVHDLEPIESVEELRRTISSSTAGDIGRGCEGCGKSVKDSSTKQRCMHFAYVQKRLLQSLDAVPPFTDFLNKALEPEV